jgi:membrane protease subunit (stomatin/prohibitin family)
MGFFSKRGLIDRVKFDGTQDQVIWKFPHDNLTTKGQIIVNQSQQAVFFKEGAYLDTFGPGTHTLSTDNIPILQNLINLPFGGESPFTAEVWYVNCRVFKENFFGTQTPISVRDPEYRFTIPIRAFGQYSFKIVDCKKFMETIVGTQFNITTEDIQEKFQGPLMSKLKDRIAEYAIDKKISVLDMPAKADEIGEEAKKLIQKSFNDFGIELVELFIESINYPEDDPNVQKINEAFANKLTRDIEGTSYAQERQFDIMDNAAQNEGMSGTAMGMGMGAGMGASMGASMGNMANNNLNQVSGTPPTPPPSVSFHVSLNGQQSGPFNLDALKQMIQNGQVNKETYVWKEGYANWVTASEAPEIAPLFSSIPPPPPGPPGPPPTI